jgi:DNA topoisomerase-2
MNPDDLKLSKTIHTSNMWLMTQSGIKKYESPEEILFDYAKCRLSFYKLRKKNLIDTLNEKLSLMNTKAKFIEFVITEQIKVFRQTRSQIEQSMKRHSIDEKYWDDLLNIKTYQYTQEEIEKLNRQVREADSELQKTTQTTISDMWKYDIDLVQG